MESRPNSASGRSLPGWGPLVLPLLLLILWVLPLIAGQKTLFMRDVSQFHLPAKMAQAEGLRNFELWSIDPYRGGGQPLLGNPNLAPLYPSSLLLAFFDPVWAVNAHFWLHLLLAPFTAMWLGRVLGLDRSGAAAAGIFYASSGVFLSHMNFFNLIAGATWIPAFCASAVVMAGLHRVNMKEKQVRFQPLILGLLWALMLLGGDPILAVLAFLCTACLVLALSEGGIREKPRALAPALWRLGVSMVLGSLVALPQIVETLRILPLSFRGYQGYSEAVILLASLNPLTLFEALLPFAFGKPDLTFWGGAAFGEAGNPFFWSLFPGVAAWICILSSGVRPTRVRLACWAVGLLGLMIALGGYNPVMRFVIQLPGASLARYPIKALVLTALMGSLLAGWGAQRLIQGRLRAWPAAVALGAFYTALLGAASIANGPLLRKIEGLLPAERLGFATTVLNDWRAVALALIGLIVVATALAAALRSRPAASKSPLLRASAYALHALLIFQVASQIFLLRPLLPMDDASMFRSAPPIAKDIHPGESLVLAGSGAFGPQGPRNFPDTSSHWIARREWNDMYPVAGIPLQQKYELTFSPEGLDAFLARMTLDAAKRLPAEPTVRLLEAVGVDLLLTERPLPELSNGPDGPLTLRAQHGSFGQTLFLYEVRRSAPEISFATDLFRGEHLGATIESLIDPGFDVHTAAALPGSGPPESRAPGTLEIVENRRDLVQARVSSPEGGVVLIQRSHLPLYRATVNGEPSPISPANIGRMAIEVPAGDHEVRLFVYRTPFLVATGVGVLALALLVLFALRVAPLKGSAPAS